MKIFCSKHTYIILRTLYVIVRTSYFESYELFANIFHIETEHNPAIPQICEVKHSKVTGMDISLIKGKDKR